LPGLALLAAACASGCGGEDREHLAGVGRKLAERLQAVRAETSGKLARGWQAARADGEELSLDLRVSVRLRYERELADAAIEVTADGAEVELRGRVRNAGQHRRALELAEATAGVDKVNDALEEPREDP